MCDLRRLLVLAVLAAGGGGLTAAADPAVAAVEIVREGEAVAILVVAPEAPEPVRAAALRLMSVIEHATGATLAMGRKAPAAGPAIFVGPGPWVEAFGIDQSALDCDDAFDIAFPSSNAVVIVGRGSSGTEFGVNAFLERFLGVRWLMPGPFGTHVPSTTDLLIPMEPVRESPSFVSRQLEVQGIAIEWAQRNRMITRQLGQAHQLNRLFTAEDGKLNPQFFPRGYTPSGMQGWQPCFNPTATGNEAIRRIVKHFDQNPWAGSYALSINDNGNYCRCPYCGPKLHLENYSEAYWPWVNHVAEGVLAKHPGKRFGALAYNNVIRPPEGPVNSAVVPFLTYDRLKWIHPDVRRGGEELTRQWHAKVPELAWYDYIYGNFYVLPRVHFAQMAETLRWGYDNGVRHYYAEAYPNFGEGPKLYVLLKLLWNKDADVNALLREWYVGVGGEEAAPHLAKYYAFWEHLWTKRILESPWFRQAGTYMPFYTDPSYLLLVSEKELGACRKLMETALAKAETPEQKQRVGTLFDMFKFYEATALAYQAGEPQPVASAVEALAALDRTVSTLALGERRRELVSVEFPKNPVLALSSGEGMLKFGEDRGMFDVFSSAARWAVTNRETAGDVFARLNAIQEEYQGQSIAEIAKAALFIAEFPDKVVERANNGGFEASFQGPNPPVLRHNADGDIPGWRLWVPNYAPQTVVQLSEETPHTGKRSLRFGHGHSALQQWVPVEAGGSYIVSCRFNARLDDMSGAASLLIQPGELLSIEPGGTTDGWIKRESSLIRIPPGTTTIYLMPSFKSDNPDDYLMIDDVRVKKLVME